jgi:DNA-binding transcriptional MerR regulator
MLFNMTRSIHLSIGAFSNATQLSAKALRLYAEQGILQPDRIDRETGYRYYRPDQVRQARLVRLLRELDVPLADIARLLAGPVAIEQAMKQHMDNLRERYAQQQSAWQAVQGLLRPQPQQKAAAIARIELQAMTVLSRSFLADGKTLMIRAQTLLAEMKIAGHAGLDTDAAFMLAPGPLSDNDETALELCVPCAGPAQRLLPAQMLACAEVNMAGGAPDWTAASDALFDWFDHNGAVLEGMPLILMRAGGWQLAWPIS